MDKELVKNIPNPFFDKKRGEDNPAPPITKTLTKQYLPKHGSITCKLDHPRSSLGISEIESNDDPRCHARLGDMAHVKDTVNRWAGKKITTQLNDLTYAAKIHDGDKHIETYQDLKKLYERDTSEDLRAKVQYIVIGWWKEKENAGWATKASSMLMEELGWAYSDGEDTSTGFIQYMITAKKNDKAGKQMRKRQKLSGHVDIKTR